VDWLSLIVVSGLLSSFSDHSAFCSKETRNCYHASSAEVCPAGGHAVWTAGMRSCDTRKNRKPPLSDAEDIGLAELTKRRRALFSFFPLRSSQSTIRGKASSKLQNPHQQYSCLLVSEESRTRIMKVDENSRLTRVSVDTVQSNSRQAEHLSVVYDAKHVT
jgi:hypothetical protein